MSEPWNDYAPVKPKGPTYGSGAPESGQQVTPEQQTYATQGAGARDPNAPAGTAANPSYDTPSVSGDASTYHVSPQGQLSDPNPDVNMGPWADYQPEPHKRSIGEDVAGYFANANRGVGYGDELSAGLHTAWDVASGHSGPDVVQTFKDEMGHQRKLEDDYSGAHPVLAANGRALGGAALMTLPLGPGAEAFRGGSVVGNALRGGTIAATSGATSALADRGSLPERVSAAESAMVDPVTIGLGAVMGGAVGPKTTRAEAPSLDELTTQKNAAYKAVDDSGVTVPPEDFASLTTNMAGAMDQEGFNAGLHPKAAAMLERIGKSDRGAGGASPTLTQLDQLRQQVGRDVASSNDPGERRMGQIMRGQIDDYIASIPGTGGLTRARDLNTRVSKLRSLDNLDEAAADRAANSGSGGNVQNALRQNVTKFQNNTGNLTPDEQAAARLAIRGGPIQNALRMVGKLSPEGNGLAALAHTTTLAAELGTGHSPVALAQAGVAAGGAIARRVSNLLAERNVQALRDLIASGGDAAKEVDRQLGANPQGEELRRQLANDLAVQVGVQHRAQPPVAGASAYH